MRRRLDRDTVMLSYLEGRQRGLSVPDAATAAGVHVATICRWRHLDPAFDALLRELAMPTLADPMPLPERYERLLTLARPGEYLREKPSVLVHRDCPACGDPVQVRKVGRHFGAPFWRCGRWPKCSWASWRPRHPDDCPTCAGARYWSHSRKSIACPCCRVRTRVR